MSLEKQIDYLIEGRWFIPSSVIVDDGLVSCQLEHGAEYSYQDAYARSPHLELMNASTDDAILAFVKNWGPPYSGPLVAANTCATFTLPDLRSYREWFTALNELAWGLTDPTSLSSRLCRFLVAAEMLQSTSFTSILGVSPLMEMHSLLNVSGITGDWRGWIGAVDEMQLLTMCEKTVNVYLLPRNLVLRVVGEPEKRALSTGWGLSDLSSALRWMVWHDIFQGESLYRCSECDRFFKGDDKRERKFCDEVCASRFHKRKWKRKNDAARKAAKGKGLS